MAQKKSEQRYRGSQLTKSQRAQWIKWDKEVAKHKKETARIERIMKIDKALGDKKGFMKSSKKVQKEMRKLAKMPMGRKLKPSAAKLFREASQKQSKRAIRDAVKITKKLAKKVPYVAAAIIARDVVKGISKATCSKRGGKWVSGKCKGAKKDTRKITSPQVRDPISKR